MNTLITLAEAWWPLYATHMIEVSLFILLVWAVDRWLTLETRLRYALYLLALAKVFVPPVLAIPIPEFLVFSTNVTVDAPVYSGVVSEAIAVSPAQAPTLPPAFYLFCLWTLSVLVWAGVAVWKYAAFHRMLKSAIPVELAPKIASLNAPGNLNVFSKPTLPSPILVGLVRPRLYLPSKWSSWSPDELRGVVRHELAHYERRDIYVLILQAVATALFCANPLIWLLNRRLIYIRELRCDEAVLRETNLTPAEYGRLLLGFVDRRPAPSALTLYLIERETTLKKRLEHILRYKAGNIHRSKRQFTILLLVGLMIVPFSIREAYTQSERDSGALTPPEGGRGTELKQVQRTAPPVTGNSDTVKVVVPTDDEAEVETKPVPISQFKSSVIIQDVFMQFVNYGTAPDTGFAATVTLDVMADVDGSVEDVKVMYVQGPAGFKNAVKDAVSRMKSKPAKHDSENSPVWFTQRMSYQWHGTSKRPNPANLPATPDTGLIDVRDIDQIETKPHPIRIVAPEYPEAARDEELEGEVLLKFIVNVDSSVSDVTVLKGPDIFHNAATDAALQWRFRPAKHHGEVVPVWIKMPMGFTLRLGEKDKTSSIKTTGRLFIETPEPTSTPPPGNSNVGGARVFEILDVDEKPVNLNLHAIRPNYPDSAKEAGLTGSVFLKFKINVDGSVSDVQVLKGDKIFRKPAIEAVKRLRYTPAELDGKPVPVWMTQRIAFALPEPRDDTTPDASDAGPGN